MLLVLELQEAKYELQEAKYDFVKGAHNPNQPLPDVRFERVNHHLFGSKNHNTVEEAVHCCYFSFT